MAKQDADVSPEHFKWLVDGRSANSSRTSKLYKYIFENKEELKNNAALARTAQELIGIAFSLWRAVFLSDTQASPEQTLDDMMRFMVSLISDNTVIYSTDKSTRNWSFRYYLDNAVNRLDLLVADGTGIVRPDAFYEVENDKEEWMRAESVFELAIDRFETALKDAALSPGDRIATGP